jgi:hypothetical protein
MANSKFKNIRGITLIELIIAMSAAIIVVLVVGTLLVSGQRSWTRAFRYAYARPQLDAMCTTITFGITGRKSNRMDYKIYKISDNKFTQVTPVADPEEVLKGEAVEFHYWKDDLDASVMKTDIKGTAYALFYLDGDKLMLDTGPYPPGGVDAAGHRIEGDGVSTITLAENVINLQFSHTTRDLAGDGKGCVRMNMTIGADGDEPPTTVTAATLMRNAWP